MLLFYAHKVMLCANQATRRFVSMQESLLQLRTRDCLTISWHLFLMSVQISTLETRYVSIVNHFPVAQRTYLVGSHHALLLLCMCRRGSCGGYFAATVPSRVPQHGWQALGGRLQGQLRLFERALPNPSSLLNLAQLV